MDKTFREWVLDALEGFPSLDGRFSNLKRLNGTGGDGNFSLIFTARDSTSSNPVVLKFFHPEKLADPYRLGCFKREALLLERFRGQPDIAMLIAPLSEAKLELPIPGTPVAFSLPLPYYALELASGSLRERMQALPRMTPLERLDAFRAVCRGVQRMHKAGMAHRDLKPGNFLVTSSSAAALADFGSAREIEGEPLLSKYIGPAGDTRYCAPEVLACLHEADPGIAYSADMFALGAILFELFTSAQLGVYLLGPLVTADLINSFAPLGGRERVARYEEIVSEMADRYPLPSMRDFEPTLPGSIGDRLDTLYKGLSAFDHKVRTREFESVFRQISSCTLILRNEEKYQSWRRQRDLYRGIERNGAGNKS